MDEKLDSSSLDVCCVICNNFWQMTHDNRYDLSDFRNGLSSGLQFLFLKTIFSCPIFCFRSVHDRELHE